MTVTKKKCAGQDCDRIARARGFCMKHYQRWRTANGAVPLRRSVQTWYCKDCVADQRPGSYPCRLCCGFTGRREQVSEAAQAPS